MKVIVKLITASYPEKDIEESMLYAGRKLSPKKDSIKVEFSEKNPKQVILKFWIPDRAYNKAIDDIFETVKMCCINFYEDISVTFEDDRKRKPRSK